LGALENVGIAAGISQISLTEGLLFPVLGAILDFRMSVYDDTSAYPGYNYEQNTYMIPKPTCS